MKHFIFLKQMVMVLSFPPCTQALYTFNTAVLSPIYYTMFTSLTMLASVIMFKICVSIAVAYLFSFMLWL